MSWAISVRSRKPMPTRAAAMTAGAANEPNSDAKSIASDAARTPSMPMIMILVFWMSAAAFFSIFE